MIYIKTVSELSADTSTIDIPYPDRYGKLIALGASAQLLRKGQQEEAVALQYQNEFEMGIEKMKQQLEDRNTDGSKVVLDVMGDQVNFERQYATTIVINT